jgi:hypothetical protein
MKKKKSVPAVTKSAKKKPAKVKNKEKKPVICDMTEAEWVEKFKPIVNHIDKNAAWDGTLFECSERELDFISDQQKHKIWTYIDGDDDEYAFIVEGWRVYGRLGYFITEKPWNREYRITISEYDEDS